MKLILSYLKEYKRQSILAPIFKMLEAILELIVPLVMVRVIDVGIVDRHTEYVIRMILVLLGLGIVAFGVAILAQYFAAKSAIASTSKMRADLFAKIMSLSKASSQEVGTSELITRITSDTTQLQNGINMFLRLFLRAPFIVFGAFVMAFSISAKASIIFAVVIIILFIIVFAVMYTTIPKFAKIQKQVEKLFLIVGENLEGARVVRAFSNQSSQESRFDGSNVNIGALQRSSGAISAVLNPATFFVINAGIIVVLFSGAGMVEVGGLTKGEVVALVNYMNQILVELIKLANLIILLMRAYPSIGRIAEILNMRSDERLHNAYNKEVSQSDIILEINNVSFVYHDASKNESDEKYALRNVSASIKEGGTLGIIGGTASGKSTLLALIRHVYDVTSGEIKLMGRNVDTMSDADIASIIGYVPQRAELFKGSIRDNIDMGRKLDSKNIDVAIDASQSRNIIEAKPAGLDELIEENARNLSGGQRQRLTIARALAAQPRVVILDDSSSALDAATDAALRESIAALPWKPAVVIVSQRASSVKSCDNILVLDSGRCVGYGTSDKLIEICDIYREIYESQFK